jgi:thioredoxin
MPRAFSTMGIAGSLACALLVLHLPLLSCGEEQGETDRQEANAAPAAHPDGAAGDVQAIGSSDEFKRIVETSGDRLLLFDFHADWCRPCKILAPVLKEVARENADKATVYSIDIDKHRSIAAQFGVSSIPFVAFVRNGQGVHAMVGVQPKAAYVRSINRFAASEQTSADDAPDGEIVGEKRTIRISTAASPGRIYVHRGETVSLILEATTFPYSIHIPRYGVSQKGIIGEELAVTFKAEEIGVFPIFCNGKCPTGDGERYGQIVVMQYEASGDANFTELSAENAKELLEGSNPLVLDVRTPNEFYDGHLEDAMLIPLHQLERRLAEINDYKERDILVYCRNGNRSTVAAQILIRHGFRKLYNLRPGTRGWEQQGYPIVK